MLSDVIADSSKWELVPKGEYFLIKNSLTGETLNIEHQKGFVEHSKIQDTAYSGQWKKETVDRYVRFVNRWKPNQVIHTEDNLGYLQAGAIHQGAWRSQWTVNE